MGCSFSSTTAEHNPLEPEPEERRYGDHVLAQRLQEEENRNAQLEAESAALAQRLQEEEERNIRLESESMALARRLGTASATPPHEVAAPATPTPQSNPLPKVDMDLRHLIQSLSVAEQHTECVICFDNMYERPCATLMHRGKNACSHFLHVECAEGLLAANRRQCPHCRTAFDGVRRVPICTDDPEGWFFCVDVEGDGRLSRQQVPSDPSAPSQPRHTHATPTPHPRHTHATPTPRTYHTRRWPPPTPAAAPGSPSSRTTSS